jgi:peptide alpha-N-acetyltransferase
MKALFELGLGDEAKAELTAKDALLKSKMKSMFCWHTYGTVLKQKKNFLEAVKCYEQALNFEKENMQVLREVASLQVHVRDYNGHIATRWRILQLKPNVIQNWVSFAISYHLVRHQLRRKATSTSSSRRSSPSRTCGSPPR